MKKCDKKLFQAENNTVGHLRDLLVSNFGILFGESCGYGMRRPIRSSSALVMSIRVMAMPRFHYENGCCVIVPEQKKCCEPNESVAQVV